MNDAIAWPSPEPPPRPPLDSTSPIPAPKAISKGEIDIREINVISAFNNQYVQFNCTRHLQS